MNPALHRALTLHSIWAAFPQFPVRKLADAAPLNSYIDEVGGFLDQRLTDDQREYACQCSDFSQSLKRHQGFQGPLAARLFAIGTRHWLARQDRSNPHSNTGMLMAGSFWKAYSAECIRTFAPDRSLDWRSHVAAVSEFTKSLIKATWGNANTEYYCRHMPDSDDHEVVMDSLGMLSLSPEAGGALVFHEFMHGIKRTDSAFWHMYKSAQMGGYKGTPEQLHDFFNSYEDIAVNVAGGSVFANGLDDFRELYRGVFLTHAYQLKNEYSLAGEFWVCAMARGIGETHLPFTPSAEVQALLEKHRESLDDITGARSLPIAKNGLIRREICLNPEKLEPFSRYRGEVLARLFFTLQDEFSAREELPENLNGPSNGPPQPQPGTKKWQVPESRNQPPQERTVDENQSESAQAGPNQENSLSQEDEKQPGRTESKTQKRQKGEEEQKAAEGTQAGGEPDNHSGDHGEKPEAAADDPADDAQDLSPESEDFTDQGGTPRDQGKERDEQAGTPGARGNEPNTQSKEPGDRAEKREAGDQASELDGQESNPEPGDWEGEPELDGEENQPGTGDEGSQNEHEVNEPGVSGGQPGVGKSQGPSLPDFSGLGEVGKGFELREPLLGGKDQEGKTTADPDGKFKALQDEIPGGASAGREDLLEDGILSYGAPVDLSALREVQREFAPAVRRGKRLFLGIRENAQAAVQHRAKLVEEGETFSIRGMSLRRSDPEHTLIYENPAQAIAVNHARFGIILDMSGSTESGERFRKLVEMASVAALAIEDAGYQTALGLFSAKGLVLYHAEYPKSEKMRRLGGLIKVVRHSHDLRKGGASVGLTEKLGFMGGTESEKAVGTFVEAITKTQSRKPGHFHGLIFTDGELTESRLAGLISANPNLTWSVLCEGGVTQQAKDHFGKENTYAVQLDDDFITTIFDAFSDSIKKFGSFQSAAKIRKHYQRTLRDARRMEPEKAINIIK
jgi:hypothetical protein